MQFPQLLYPSVDATPIETATIWGCQVGDASDVIAHERILGIFDI